MEADANQISADDNLWRLRASKFRLLASNFRLHATKFCLRPAATGCGKQFLADAKRFPAACNRFLFARKVILAECGYHGLSAALPAFNPLETGADRSLVANDGFRPVADIANA